MMTVPRMAIAEGLGTAATSNSHRSPLALLRRVRKRGESGRERRAMRAAATTLHTFDVRASHFRGCAYCGESSAPLRPRQWKLAWRAVARFENYASCVSSGAEVAATVSRIPRSLALATKHSATTNACLTRSFSRGTPESAQKASEGSCGDARDSGIAVSAIFMPPPSTNALSIHVPVAHRCRLSCTLSNTASQCSGRR